MKLKEILQKAKIKAKLPDWAERVRASGMDVYRKGA